MPTITRVRGDRLKIRQCVREVTVAAAGFEYPENPTGLFYSDSSVGLNNYTLAGSLNQSPNAIGAHEVGSQSAAYNPDDGFIYYGVDADIHIVKPDGTGHNNLGPVIAGQSSVGGLAVHPGGDVLWVSIVHQTGTGTDVGLKIRAYPFPLPAGDLQNSENFTQILSADGAVLLGDLTVDIDRGYLYASNSNHEASTNIHRVAWDGSVSNSLYSAGAGNSVSTLRYNPVDDLIYFTHRDSTVVTLRTIEAEDGSNELSIANLRPSGARFERFDINIGGQFMIFGDIVIDNGEIRLTDLAFNTIGILREAAAGQLVRALNLLEI